MAKFAHGALTVLCIDESMTQGQSSFTMSIQLERSSHGWKCEQCGLPGVRLSTSSGSNDAGSRAYYKCVPCNRSLGPCPCTTPGARTTSTCPCSDIEAESGEEQVPRRLSNADFVSEEDWEANCSPGFMVSRFKAQGKELLLWP
ncbi:unnamed protein product [Penicillium viridicatum]